MSVSIRSQLIAGVSALAAAVIVIPSSVPSRPPTVAPTSQTPPVALAASVRPLIVEPPSPQKFAQAVAAIERIDPSARKTAVRAVTPAAAPAPLNAASDLITSGYQFIQYWVDYGVQLTNYVLGFIPYGYLIAAQVNIFYYDLIRPISNSVVYDLINPVVNDPLNPASYVNGLINVGQASINALINTGISEFNYFFGWLIPPLPPLPLAVAKSVPTVEEQPAATLTARVESAPEPAGEGVAPPAGAVVEKHQVVVADAPAPIAESHPPVVGEPEVVPESATVVDDTVKVPEPKPEVSTTTSVNGVQAQGEVRAAVQGQATTTVKDVKDEKDADEKASPTKTDPPAVAEAPATKTAEKAPEKTTDRDPAEKS